MLPDFNENPTNTKHQPLTHEIVSAYNCQPILQRLITTTAEQLGKHVQELRILDYGSGRGEVVGKLRLNFGSHCYGVEIEPDYIKSSEHYFSNIKDDFPIVSRVENNRTIFPDEYFDVILTNQVLEHVKDIEAVTREINRLLSQRGVIFHIYPSAYSIMEPHMFLPVSHWFPKNAVRKALIRIMLGLGMGAKYFAEYNNAERTQIFYDFSISDTYYRSQKELKKYFASSIFLMQNVERDKFILRGGLLSRLASIPVIGHLLGWGYGTFHQRYILLSRYKVTGMR